MLTSRPSVFLSSLTLFVVLARTAAASPFAERDLDLQHVVGDAGGGKMRASSDLRGRSWVSLVGFTGTIGGAREVGAMAVVGLALDRIAAGPVRLRSALADGPVPPAPAAKEAPRPPRIELSPLLARSAVAAAWRAIGLGKDDARLEAILSRARWSALLPETRLRAMRRVDDRQSTDAVPLADQTTANHLYDASGANLWLEARLTWRLDRLLYADDEPAFERIRLDRQDARTRIAARVLEALFQWQRASLDAQAAQAGTREEIESSLRVVEAESTLDVLTSGWFVAWRARAPSP